MAKAKKEKVNGIVEPVVEDTVIVEQPNTETNNYENVEAAITYYEVDEPEEITESDEIIFLRLLLHKQHDGGWGHHLDDLINNRIKELKK